jgi:hypothetical protein
MKQKPRGKAGLIECDEVVTTEGRRISEGMNSQINGKFLDALSNDPKSSFFPRVIFRS